MKKILSFAVILMLLGTTGITFAEDNADPEKTTWNKVDEMDVTQLTEFLKTFPDGKYAKDAQFDLLLHQKIADIKAGKVKNPVLIPFDKLGERWKYWCEANPERGAVGVYRSESTAGIFRAMGCATIRTDYSGMVMAPTGDGSIIAIKTSGFKYQYIGGIIFESEKDGTLYFTVIKDKGLAHIYGKGKLTMPDGKEIELK